MSRRSNVITLDDVLGTLGNQPSCSCSTVCRTRTIGACLRVSRRGGCQYGDYAEGSRLRDWPADRHQEWPAADQGGAHRLGDQSRVPCVTEERHLRHRYRRQGREIQLYTADWPQATTWVMGAEGEGVRRLTRRNLRPAGAHSMLGSVSGLNVDGVGGVFTGRRRRG